jgi:hypothetical protein
MLRGRIQLKAQKLRLAVGRHHPGHFDREGHHIEGASFPRQGRVVGGGSSSPPASSVEQKSVQFVVRCNISLDPSTRDLYPELTIKK